VRASADRSADGRACVVFGSDDKVGFGPKKRRRLDQVQSFRLSVTLRADDDGPNPDIDQFPLGCSKQSNRTAIHYVSASALETFSAISLATSTACVVITEWAAPGIVTREPLVTAPLRISALLAM
jgi:hypothetical protein